MSRALSLGSTMINLVFTMIAAWITGWLCDKGMPRMIVSGGVYIIAAAALAPAALAMRAGGVAAAWVLHLGFLILVGVIGGLLAVSMCPLYPPEVRTSGMNFAHQVSRQSRGVEGVLVAVVPWTQLGQACAGKLSGGCVGVRQSSWAHHNTTCCCCFDN